MTDAEKTKKVAVAREKLWCAQRAKLSQETILKLKRQLAEIEAA